MIAHDVFTYGAAVVVAIIHSSSYIERVDNFVHVHWHLKLPLHQGNMFPSTYFLYWQQNCCQFVARLLLDTKGYKSAEME